MSQYEQPAKVEISTLYGRAILSLTGGTTIYLDANTNGGSDPGVGWTVHGVRYFVSGHLQRTGGEWELATSPSDPYGFQAVYISRAGWEHKRDEPSPSAKTKIRAEVVQAVNRWASQTVHAADALVEAERRRLVNAISTLDEKIAEINRGLDGLVSLRAQAIRARHALEAQQAPT